MRNWDTRDESGTDKGCEWEKDWEDVQLVSKHLGVPCRMVGMNWLYSSACSQRRTQRSISRGSTGTTCSNLH